MHDDLLERRLRSALQDEARRVPFTITAAELERRAVLRGRRSPSRLTLLFAAAVTVGAVGGGMVIGGLANDQDPSPTAPLTAISSDTPASQAPGPVGPQSLPSLDELVAEDPGSVLLAQAHDGAVDRVPEGAPDTREVRLPFHAAASIRVSFACLGDGTGSMTLSAPGVRPAWSEPKPCNGTPFERSESGGSFDELWLRTEGGDVQWRAVVRGDPIIKSPPLTDEIVLPRLENREELLWRALETISPNAPAWGPAGIRIVEVGAIPNRYGYSIRLWCDPGAQVSLVLGDELGGRIVPTTETLVLCDDRILDGYLGIAQPNGSRVFVAANPETQWSLLVGAEPAPIGVADDIPGWVVNAAVGPELNFERQGYSLSSAGVEGGGPLLVTVDCAGPEQTIEVRVDVTSPYGDAFETFLADCLPEGARTSSTFETTGDSGYIAAIEAPGGTWTAVTALVPLNVRALDE